MKTFSIRDLRERTGELVRTAEAGELSVVAGLTRISDRVIGESLRY